jgi:hypothetical protein
MPNIESLDVNGVGVGLRGFNPQSVDPSMLDIELEIKEEGEPCEQVAALPS